MPAYHLRTFYLARQSTWGTSATPNVRLEGVTDGSVTVNINDEVIDTIGWNVGNITMRQLRDSEITISLVATYEQILYILHGLFGAVTPTGSSAPYVWMYKVPRSNTVTPQIYTVVYGIDNDVYQLKDCIISEVTMKGEVKTALELEITLLCPNAPVVTSVPAVSLTPVNVIYVREAEFYLADALINPFSTPSVEATLKSFEISINPNRHIKRFIGNDSFYGDGKWEINGSIVLEFNPTSKAVIDNVLNTLTIRNAGFKFTYSANNDIKLLIDFPFIITDSFELFSDNEGNATVELSIKAVYTTLNDTVLQIRVITGINTLP